MDEGEEVQGSPIIAGGEASEVFELVEAAPAALRSEHDDRKRRRDPSFRRRIDAGKAGLRR
jgi:hypothetical protein